MRSLSCSLLWLIPTIATAEDADTIFCIGEPDANAGELGGAREGYPRFLGVFPEPVVYKVNRSKAVDWPFVHPAPRDTWAGGRVHVFTIELELAAKPRSSLFLVVGLAGAAPTQRSLVVVSVSGEDLPAQTAPAGAIDPVYDPGGPGKAQTLVFPIPADRLREGNNRLAIRLEEESWIVYDYVALDPSGGPDDMPGFRPRAAYIREMQRYGVLPVGLSGDEPVDPYHTDQAYWRSLWHKPPPR